MILNMCLLAFWVQRYYDVEFKLWKKLLMVIIKLIPLIYFVSMKGMIPPSGKWFDGLLKQPKWTINGKLAMVRELGYDRINGL
jgi:hypothetical protein